MNIRYHILRSISTVTLAVILALSSFAQQNSVTAPSVSVSSTGKQANVPVNYNNGTANVAVPITAITEYDINLPISLSYQTGGVLVNQVASNVGLGWSLNAGGALFRIARGVPDEQKYEYNNVKYRGYDHYLEALENNDPNLNNAQYFFDKEPDIFVFNFAGASGRFFKNKDGEFVQIAKSNIKIEREDVIAIDPLSLALVTTIKSFTITLEDGSKIIFGNEQWETQESTSFVEKNHAEFECYTGEKTRSTWFVDQYISTQNHTLTFNYEDEHYTVPSLSGDPLIVLDGPRGCTPEHSPHSGEEGIRVDKSEIRSKRISSIEGTFCKVDFIPSASAREDLIHHGSDVPKAIEEIVVSKKNTGSFQCYDTYELNLDYFTCNNTYSNNLSQLENSPCFDYNASEAHYKKRLKLVSVDHTSCSGEISYNTNFGYHEEELLPRRLSAARDYWGYYNGVESNRSLVPAFEVDSDCADDMDCSISYLANRSTDFSSAKLGSLNKINYPNGEFVEIVYETHQIVSIDPVALTATDIDVGGLRIKEYHTSDGSTFYRYDASAEDDAWGYEGGYFSDFSMDICETAYPSCLQPLTDDGDPDSDPPCSGGALDAYYNFSVPCDAHIKANVRVQWSTDEECHPGTNLILCNDGSQGQGFFQLIEFTSYLANGATNISYASICLDEIGQTVDVSHEIAAAIPPGSHVDKLVMTFWSPYQAKVDLTAHLEVNIISPSHDITDQISTEHSSGRLINYPSVLVDLPEGTYTSRGQCQYAHTPYMVFSSPISSFTSINGSHISYGKVRETINGGEIGSTVYRYNNNSSILTNNLSFNKANPLLPVSTIYPPSDQMFLEPEFGLLQKVELLDPSDNPVSEQIYQYSSEVDDYIFEKKASYKRCDTPAGETYDPDDPLHHPVTENTAQVKFRSYTVLPTISTQYRDGVTVVSENEYRSDLKHYKPIRTTVYAQANPDEIKTVTTKYAYDLEDEGLDLSALINRNFVGVPLEILKDDGQGNGSKTEYVIINDRILPSRSYSSIADGGGWKQLSSVESYYSNGLPWKIKKRSAPKLFEYTYENALLKKSSYENQKTTYQYDNLRRLTKIIKTPDDGNDDLPHPEFGQVTSFDVYDDLNRLKQKTEDNGRIVTSYDYLISVTEDDKITTTASFPMDGFGIPDRVTEQYYDTKGRNIKSVEKNYTQSGEDYITERIYDHFGRMTHDCDPGSGGCTQTFYQANPLSRIDYVSPAGSAKNISYHYGHNQLDIPNAYGGYYYKVEVTDENGNTQKSYTDVFGRTVATMDALGQLTRTNYNDRDQVLKVIPPDADESNLDLVFEYSYYPDGLLWTKNIPGKEGSYTYTYDDYDLLDTETMPNGHILKYLRNSDHPSFVEQVHLDNEVINIYTPWDESFRVYWPKSELVKVLDDNQMLSNVTSSYDDLGRALVATTEYLNGEATFTTVYDDMGNVRSLQRDHTGVGGDAFTVTKTFDFDKGLRLNKLTADFPDFDPIALQEFSYDERDWMTKTIVGDGIQDFNYTYNSRGWLAKINSVEATYDQSDDPCIIIDDPEDDCEDDKIRRLTSVEVAYNSHNLEQQLPTALNVLLKTKHYQEGEFHYKETNEMSIPLYNFSGSKELDITDTVTLVHANEYEPQDMAQAIIASLSEYFEGEDPTMNSTRIQLESNLSNAIAAAGPEDDIAYQLFGLELFYDVGNPDLDANPQCNGNISWMKWRVKGESAQAYGFQYDALNRLLQGRYGNNDDDCNIQAKNWYDVNIMDYDARGNILGIQRNGFISYDQNMAVYDQIDDISIEYELNKNQISAVTEASLTDKGYRNGGSYDFEKGNLILDGGNGITQVEYNFLDLPKRIESADGIIEIVYDANGTQLKLKQTPTTGQASTIEYQDGVEYKNGQRECIMHEEGRAVYNASLPTETGSLNQYMEWIANDHLGNTRMRYVDKNADGIITVDHTDPNLNEITGSYHYYPFGMKLEAHPITADASAENGYIGNFWDQQDVENRYQYNGIEHNDMIGHGISLASYRVHDAALGRWWQVDPKAEQAGYSLSPYCAMNDNPVSIIDPHGDIGIDPITIAVAVKALSNILPVATITATATVSAGAIAAVALTTGAAATTITVQGIGGVGNFYNSRPLVPDGYGFVEQSYGYNTSSLTEHLNIPPSDPTKGTLYQTHRGYWTGDGFSAFKIKNTSLSYYNGYDLLARMGGPIGMSKTALEITVAEIVGLGVAKAGVYAYRAYKASRIVKATGQAHHLISAKITRALNNHPTLKGAFDYSRKNTKYIYNALDEAAHKGYQTWHRQYDAKVVKWLQNNPSATPAQFDKFLHNLHQQPWLKSRIPNVNLF